jgi:hypothetical protein
VLFEPSDQRAAVVAIAPEQLILGKSSLTGESLVLAPC